MRTEEVRCWPVTRQWLIRHNDSAESRFSTHQLTRYQTIAHLGAAALGKTWELRTLANIGRSSGEDVVWVDLWEAATSRLGPAGKLADIVRNLSPPDSLFLDGLDEVMMAQQQAAGVVVQWIKSGQSGNSVGWFG